MTYNEEQYWENECINRECPFQRILDFYTHKYEFCFHGDIFINCKVRKMNYSRGDKK